MLLYAGCVTAHDYQIRAGSVIVAETDTVQAAMDAVRVMLSEDGEEPPLDIWHVEDDFLVYTATLDPQTGAVVLRGSTLSRKYTGAARVIRR